MIIAPGAHTAFRSFNLSYVTLRYVLTYVERGCFFLIPLPGAPSNLYSVVLRLPRDKK